MENIAASELFPCSLCGAQQSVLSYSRQTRRVYCAKCKHENPYLFSILRGCLLHSSLEEVSPDVWKIYKIISKKDCNTVYIGITKQTLQERLAQHIKDANKLGFANKKHMWVLANIDDLEIVKIADVSSKENAIKYEKAEIFKYADQGYRVMNIQHSKPPK